MKKSTIYNILFGMWLGFSLSKFGFGINSVGFWVILIPTIVLVQTRIYYILKEELE